MAREEETQKDPRPVAAPEGTWPPEEWPIDVMRVDENGIDLSLIENNLILSPAERIERHYRARLFIEQIQSAGREGNGPARPTAEATHRASS